VLTKCYSGDQIKKTRLAGHVAGAYRVLVGRPEERDYVENLAVDGEIILKWIFKT
jgi:hypothetical protein